MKNFRFLVFFVFALSIISCSHDSLNESNQSPESQVLDPLKPKSDVSIECHNFGSKMEVDLLIVKWTVDTTVHFCCVTGLPTSPFPNQVPCGFLSDTQYAQLLKDRGLSSEATAIPVHEFINDPNIDPSKVVSVKVISSTSVRTSDGSIYKIKQGTYPVKDGAVNFEFE